MLTTLLMFGAAIALSVVAGGGLLFGDRSHHDIQQCFHPSADHGQRVGEQQSHHSQLALQ